MLDTFDLGIIARGPHSVDFALHGEVVGVDCLDS